MGELRWYEQDKAAVAARLQAGERPGMATTTATGPLDALVALHDARGVCAALEQGATARQRAGVADRLLLRTLAVVPCVGNGGRRGMADQRFRAPASLRQRGWSPVQIRHGDHGRQHGGGRQDGSLPGHPATLRAALARSGAQA